MDRLIAHAVAPVRYDGAAVRMRMRARRLQRLMTIQPARRLANAGIRIKISTFLFDPDPKVE
ncbi:hypothetical protein [Burkholderia sola]|uniref:hypothetical protein n=1 Tax=Burkholderia sola TaxID=2843302 RepID=UPI00338F4E5C